MGWQADGKIMYLSAKCRKSIILGALVWSRGMAGRRKDNVYGQKSEIIHDVPGSVISYAEAGTSSGKMCGIKPPVV